MELSSDIGRTAVPIPSPVSGRSSAGEAAAPVSASDSDSASTGDAVVTWTIGAVLGWSTRFLTEHGSPSPRLDAEILLAEALQCRRIDLYLSYDKPLAAAERGTFRTLLVRRGRHEPVAYIIGRKEFYGLEFAVDRRVLIPRPETEHVVDRCLEVLAGIGAPRIIEVGVGSGCIAISLARKIPTGATIHGWDLSADALELCRLNVKTLATAPSSCSSSLTLQRCDATDPSPWVPFAGSVDLVVSNPPYISQLEVDSLPRSVRDFEPGQALFAGKEGLDVISGMAGHALSALRPGGWLVLEIGATQKHAVTSILETHGWTAISSGRDYAGLDRVVSARRPC